MLQPLFLAVSQLDDRTFLGVVVQSLLWSVLAFALLLFGSVELLHDAVGGGGWLGWAAGVLGGLGVLLLAAWLFVPVALVIATFYVGRVAAAVERRFYPSLPRAAGGAPLTEQTWDGVVLGAQVLLLQVVALVATLTLPGVGLLLGYLITGWAIGRGLFVAVAMLRMPRPQALATYAGRRWSVVAIGVALALASTLPPLNLLVPVVGIAAMVHVLYRN